MKCLQQKGKQMEAIKQQKMNGVEYNTLAGSPLKQGELLHCLWPDGSETVETAHVLVHQPVGGQHKQVAYLKQLHRGGLTALLLLGVKAERKGFRDQVLKTQAKFDAAVETVVKKVMAQAKTVRKSRRKTKKSKRRVRN